LTLREQLKDLLKLIAEETNGNTEKTISDKSICTEYSKLPPDEVKNWLGVLCSDGLIKEVDPQQSDVDFKLYPITQKGLGIPEKK
jgi:hypothetical protein